MVLEDRNDAPAMATVVADDAVEGLVDGADVGVLVLVQCVCESVGLAVAVGIALELQIGLA